MSNQALWSPDDSPHAIALSEANAWRWAVDLCARRIHANGVDQQTDARLYLLALRQLLKAAQMAADAVAGTNEAVALDAALCAALFILACNRDIDTTRFTHLYPAPTRRAVTELPEGVPRGVAVLQADDRMRPTAHAYASLS